MHDHTITSHVTFGHIRWTRNSRTGGGGSAIGGDEDGGMDKRNKHL